MTGHNNLLATGELPRSREHREYGRNGIFGILTPQGNPTVEPELGILLPAGGITVTARLTSTKPTLRERLIGYVDNLPDTIASFSDLAPDVTGFACTGSSYLVDPLVERRTLQAIEDARNYEIVTAARAVQDACGVLGARRIALISPYPEWLTAASRAHWERNGLTVTAVLQLPASLGKPPAGGGDKHGIYSLTTQAILPAIKAFQIGNADAILVAGTGMPSLRIILELQAERPIPILSSNLCLAWSLASKLGMPKAGSESPLYGGWHERLARA